MQINNPLQMNDWDIKKLLKVALAIQLAVLGAIGLDNIGLQIPIIRQLIGFIYLTFIPGILILRILKLHKLGNIETLLYTVGLSIATLMFTGLFINMVYPFLGISGPVSAVPLVITICVVVLGLCYISYRRDKDFSDPSSIKAKEILSPPVLFLCLIPFLSIFGTYLVNVHHDNNLLMVLIVILAIVVVLIAFDKFIPNKLYPLAVFIVAISLLYHASLISMYLWGWDIQFECYLCNLVKMNSIWDPTIPRAYNAMLSIVMLAPIFSDICNMNVTWVFKIIYPMLFSLVSLGLYRAFQKQTDDKIAFLSVFFFISLLTFYSEMLALARQQIAELFLILLILLMIDKNMDRMKRAGLFMIIAFSLAVSHYGLSYIFMFSLVAVCGMFFLDRRRKNHDNITKAIITPRFVALYITFTLAWYIYVSSSSAFEAIVHIGDHIASSIFTDFLNPEAAEGAELIIWKTVSPLHEVTKYLHLISQFFIVIGIYTLLAKHKEMKFEKEYAAFSYVNFMICFAGIAVPFFASSLNTTRLYQITLIFLAPFCVIGGVAFFRMVDRVVKKPCTDQIVKSSLKVLSVFLVIFLLFSSGWVYEVAKDHPGSISLSQESIEIYGDDEAKNAFYAAYYLDGDISGVKWISKNRDDESKIYGDYTRNRLVFASYGMMPDEYILTNTTKVPDGSYIYLGYPNVRYGLMYGPDERQYWNITDISSLLNNSSEIYNNGYAQVHYL
jgi:uncharacterized membrane protein